MNLSIITQSRGTEKGCEGQTGREREREERTCMKESCRAQQGGSRSRPTLSQPASPAPATDCRVKCLQGELPGQEQELPATESYPEEDSHSRVGLHNMQGLLSLSLGACRRGGGGRERRGPGRRAGAGRKGERGDREREVRAGRGGRAGRRGRRGAGRGRGSRERGERAGRGRSGAARERWRRGRGRRGLREREWGRRGRRGGGSGAGSGCFRQSPPARLSTSSKASRWTEAATERVAENGPWQIHRGPETLPGSRGGLVWPEAGESTVALFSSFKELPKTTRENWTIFALGNAG